MISFPRLGNLTIGLEALFNEINLNYIQSPVLTKQTVALGCRYAPESACLPFKFCWHCLLEIQMVEQNAQVYSINEDGGLQWYKKISCTKPGVDGDIAI